MSSHARFVGIATSLFLALATLIGPLAPPAAAGYSTLCWTYSGCAAKGYGHAGYAQNNRTMYWRMYAGHNCTNYVAYRMVKAGMPNVRPWEGSGNAENWGLAMRSITDQTPRVGAVAWWKQNVWPAGSAGHVAYVERVVSPSEIIVSQDSWGGEFSWARITKSGGGWPSGFVHFLDDREIDEVARPTVTGVAKVGTTLSATRGSWSPSDVSVTYRWRADGVGIVGATAPTFTPTAAQQGKKMSVRVVARKDGYDKAAMVSVATDPVLPAEFTLEEAPVITPDAPAVGTTVEASPGAWSPTPQEVVYRWKANWDVIEGADSPTLEVTPELIGKRLRLVTVAKHATYDNVRTVAAAADTVAPGTFEATEAPRVTGVPRLDETFELDPGLTAPEGTSAVQWYRGAEPVADAVGTSYRTTAEDLGHRLRAVVTWARDGYTPLVQEVLTPWVKTEPTIELDLEPLWRAGRIRVNAAVTAPGLDAVDGVVRIRAGGLPVVEAAVVDGQVTRRISGLRRGERTVTVRFLSTRSVAYASATGTVQVR